MFRALAVIKKLPIKNPANLLVVARRFGTPVPPCQPEDRASIKDNFNFELTMNDLPSPKGPWKEKHDELQSYYNKVLIGGVLLFISGFLGVYYTHEFHYFPPDAPTPRK